MEKISLEAKVLAAVTQYYEERAGCELFARRYGDWPLFFRCEDGTVRVVRVAYAFDDFPPVLEPTTRARESFEREAIGFLVKQDLGDCAVRPDDVGVWIDASGKGALRVQEDCFS